MQSRWPAVVALALLALPAFAASPEDLGRRLCDALQALPERRKAECCAAPAPSTLADECSHELGVSLGAGALALDAADVDRCAADTAQALQGCDWVTPRLPSAPASCRTILRGRLDVGGRCRSSLECRDGLHCAGGDASTAGFCVPPGEPGTICGGAEDILGTLARATDDDPRHAQCAGFCMRGRCTPYVAAGGACAAHRQCAPGSHCASSRCVAGPPHALGEACSDAACADGLACIDGRCATAKKAGASCTSSLQCEAACVSGTCGMQCSAWPPAGYTAPTAGVVSGRRTRVID
jgi:hypothetical protein